MDTSTIDFEFLTSAEICKVFGKKIQKLRKTKFKSQKKFTEHIGMAFETYAQFEKTGKVSLVNFITILKGLECIDGFNDLFNDNITKITWDGE